MPSQRDIKRRKLSVESTKQITRTMEMVATAKIRHATERIAAATPYSEAMVKTLSAVAAHSIGVEHPLLEEHEQKKAASSWSRTVAWPVDSTATCFAW